MLRETVICLCSLISQFYSSLSNVSKQDGGKSKLHKTPISSSLQEVQVDFEARNPEDGDFHGIRKLLQQVCSHFVVSVEIMHQRR